MIGWDASSEGAGGFVRMSAFYTVGGFIAAENPLVYAVLLPNTRPWFTTNVI